jgi:tRNA U34 2-thiouridine synthase MnmA/TrmU
VRSGRTRCAAWPAKPASPTHDKKGLDRHLLHRRTGLPWIPRTLRRRAAGAIESPGGVEVGRQQGVPFYTLGQREGSASAGAATPIRTRGTWSARTSSATW